MTLVPIHVLHDCYHVCLLCLDRQPAHEAYMRVDSGSYVYSTLRIIKPVIRHCVTLSQNCYLDTDPVLELVSGHCLLQSDNATDLMYPAYHMDIWLIVPN